jgi:class 3 adenylate cyclase
MSSLAVAVPHHRAILTVDIEGSTTRTNPAKAQLRQVMYDLFDAALEACGITEEHRDPLVDRGDGVLVLIHPVDQAPKTLLLTTLVPTLSLLLTEHNSLRPEDGLRLRAALHAGEVHYDRQGCFGEALDITFRLLDAPEVKSRLSQTDAPLVLVVSDDIYRTVIRHRYDGIDDRAFEQTVRVRVAGQQHRGWVHVPPAAAS